MNDLIAGLTRLILKLVLLAAGLVVAAFIVAAVGLMLALWVVGAAWSRLTGRPVSPLVMRMNVQRGFNRVYRRAAPAVHERTLPEARQAQRQIDDVTDVEVKVKPD